MQEDCLLSVILHFELKKKKTTVNITWKKDTMHPSHSIILAEICKGKTATLKVNQKNPNFHWSSIYFPRTKETPLHLAAQYGHAEIIRYLIDEFTPKTVDVRNIDNKTPLHEAAQFGNYECVKILIENGAEVNAIKRSDWTPLMLACTKEEKRFEDIVDYLGEKGALLNFKNKDGWTCLHLAARNKNPSILQSLLERNIDTTSVTKNGRTALHISALHGNLQNVKLLSSKIDLNSEDSSGITPFHEATLGGNIEVMDYLAKEGADVLAASITGSNALHLAAGNGSNEVIVHLVDKYCIDVNIVNLNGHSGLHCAARKGHKSTFDLLVKLGANTEIVDACGRLARDYIGVKRT